jgi:hypothetical protein
VDERAMPVKRAVSAHADLRRTIRQTPPPTAAAAVVKTATRFAVTQERQALQQTVAIGAFSPYFATTCPIRPLAICFMSKA